MNYDVQNVIPCDAGVRPAPEPLTGMMDQANNMADEILTQVNRVKALGQSAPFQLCQAIRRYFLMLYPRQSALPLLSPSILAPQCGQ